MQIYCPKCNACYEIEEALLKNKRRRLKCSNCNEIFIASTAEDIHEDTDKRPDVTDETVEKEAVDNYSSESPTNTTFDTDSNSDNIAEDNTDSDISDSDNPNEDNDEESTNANLEQIFERLSEHTEQLIAEEKKLPAYEKLWLQLKNILGFHFKIKWSYILWGLGIFVLLSMYNYRYQIVREAPFLNIIYKSLGIKAKIPGEGLEFQNISWNFLNDDKGARLEIKGFVHNKTAQIMEMPIVHIEILDKNTALLQSQNRELKESEITPHGKISLNITVDNPAPTAKYVYLTFVDKD